MNRECIYKLVARKPSNYNTTGYRMLTNFRIILTLSYLIFHLHAYPSIIDSTRKDRPKVGLVLSGGGAKGYAHIGALKELNKLGIEFDYISGTSMGSIVGGLYAIGYSPEYIEHLVQSQDWNSLLLDKIDRRQLSLDQKSYNEQQFVSFPVSKESISLPYGIVFGQNISNLLSKMASPVHQFTSFSEFQTPFLCIGTDIANGESVVLDKGDLALAMRASMAIPTVFTPVTINGRLLVDGGLVNNFPAKELAERGCDIIIGVDVQSNIDYQIEDLNSITAILDRSAGFYRKALNDTAALYVDYYLHPDITKYGVGSFSDYDSIILKGEQVVLAHQAELQELADYLKSFPNYEMKIRDLQPLSSFVLDSVIVINNKDISKAIIISSLNFKKGDIVEMEDLEYAIKQLYGSLFFNTVKYRILPGKNGSVLEIDLEEVELGSIGVGVHYDTDHKAGLLLTGSFRNILLKNTILETAIGLSENPHARLKYYQNRGLLPSFVFAAKWSSFSFIDYLNGKDKVGQYRFSNLIFDLYLQSISKRTVALGAGMQIELSSLRNDIGIDFGVDNSSYTQNYFNFFTFLKVDRWDDSFFPHRGGKVNINAVFVTHFLKGGNLNFGEKATILSAEYDKAIPLAPRWTFRPRVNLGLSFGKGVYLSQLFLLGGQGNHYLPGMISFTGLNIGQLSGEQLLSGRMRLQYNFYKKHYLTSTLDVANIKDNKSELFDFESSAIGYGLTYGYNSFIGPIELSIMGSNFRGVSGYLNIGFWF